MPQQQPALLGSPVDAGADVERHRRGVGVQVRARLGDHHLVACVAHPRPGSRGGRRPPASPVLPSAALARSRSSRRSVRTPVTSAPSASDGAGAQTRRTRSAPGPRHPAAASRASRRARCAVDRPIRRSRRRTHRGTPSDPIAGISRAHLVGVDPPGVEAGRAAASRCARAPRARRRRSRRGSRSRDPGIPESVPYRSRPGRGRSRSTTRPGGRCRGSHPGPAPCRPRGSRHRRPTTSRSSTTTVVQARPRRRTPTPTRRRFRRPPPPDRPTRPSPRSTLALERSKCRGANPRAGHAYSDADAGRDPTAALAYEEILVVLMLSLLASAVYAVLSLLEAPVRGTVVASANQSTQLARQVAAFVFGLAPVFLVLHLVRRSGEGVGSIGLAWDRPRPGRRCVAWRCSRSSASRASGSTSVRSSSGVNRFVVPAPPLGHWWTVPVLVLNAARSRAGRRDHRPRLPDHPAAPAVVVSRSRRSAASALLRASYHLYQGWGGFARQPRDGRAVRRAVPALAAHLAVRDRALPARCRRRPRLHRLPRAISPASEPKGGLPFRIDSRLR